MDELNLLVTEAILRADTLADLNAPGAADAYREVSLREEQIADALPASDTWGAIARRGAVRAAGVAGDDQRARELAARFLAEEEASADTREEITTLIAEREATFAAHHPHLAGHSGFAELLRIHELLEKDSAFQVAC